MYPSWDIVEKAIIFWMSVWLVAVRADMRAVIPPIRATALSVVGALSKRG